MAILKFGAIITEGSGSLGGHTIQKSHGGVQLRTKPIPRTFPSVDQYAIRRINPVLQAGWHALTDSQRKIWNDWPVTHGIMNAKGDKHTLSGHSLWMKRQFSQLYAGYEIDPYPYKPVWPHPTIITDFDGNIYQSVIIGTQEWLTSNLRCTHFKNGILIPEVTLQAQWAALITSAYCWFNNNINNKVPHGALYNAYSLTDPNGLGIIDWNIPTESDTIILRDYLGGETLASGPLKQTGLVYWNSPNLGATNLSGFTSLGSGYRANNGIFTRFKLDGRFWTLTSSPPVDILGKVTSYQSTAFTTIAHAYTTGLSIRLMRYI